MYIDGVASPRTCLRAVALTIVFEDHLSVIDDNAWPAVAHVPEGRIVAVRARLAEASFAAACEKAELELGDNPDLVIEHDELFTRLATAGWTGLAESFMAGEWRAQDLSGVLAALIKADFSPRTPSVSRQDTGLGELPSELVRLFAGDGLSAFGTVFSSSVPTTVRESMPSYVPGAGKRNEPASHFVDVSHYDVPVFVEREDLGDGQRRAVSTLLDAARVGPGSHLLELPSSGGAVAIAAASRRANVDSLTGDVAYASAVKENLVFAGVDEAAATIVRESVYSGLKDWRQRYDAVVSMEKLETLAEKQRIELLRSIDRMLVLGGRSAIQVTVATDALSASAKKSLKIINEYIWPGLEFPTVEDLHRLVDRHTGLRIIAQAHVGSHVERGLAMQESLFNARLREAAAEGFDAVYRRLFSYQFALKRALYSLGMLDTVQITLTHRHRKGLR